jgi:hypothetical protein
VFAFRSRSGDTFKVGHDEALPSAGATTCWLAPPAAANMLPPPTHCRHGQVKLGHPKAWLRHLLTQVADHRFNRVDELLHWELPPAGQARLSNASLPSVVMPSSIKFARRPGQLCGDAYQK